MLVRRELILRGHQQGPYQPVIKRQHLADSVRAEEVLQRAEAQAEAIAERAQQEREQLLEEAERTFWQQAQQALVRIEEQCNAMRAAIERDATEVLIAALGHCLDEIPEPSRLRAMVGKLAQQRLSNSDITLYCHPSQQSTLQQVLQQQHLPHFRLVGDTQMESDKLGLETDTGHFEISWDALCSGLQQQCRSAMTEAEPWDDLSQT